MKPAFRAVIALMALVLTTACRVERTERPALADAAAVARADIETTLDEYEAAIANGDARRAAAFFSPEGTVTHGGTAEVSGRSDVAGVLQSVLADRRVLMNSDAIDLTSGAAWQLGQYEVTGGDTLTVERGRFVIRWTRGPEGTWRIQRLILAPLPDSVQPATDSAAAS